MTALKDKTCLTVDPGICGFTCKIEGSLKKNRVACVQIKDCECKMVNKLSESIDEITMKDLFLPLTRNPIFVSAEKACCHAACPIPSGIVKTMEIVLGLAVQKDVAFTFLKDSE